MISSSTLRTALVAGLTLAGFVLVVAFFAPRMIDVRGMSPRIAAEMSQALGQPVQVRGDIFLSLVPTPRLIVRDVMTVDGVPITLSAEEAQADLSWADLLLGRYTISKVSLVRPTIDMNWRAFSFAGGAVPRLSIERGQLNVLGLASPVEISNFNAELEPTSNGAVSWTLTGLLDGLAIESKGKLSSAGRNGARSLQSSLKLTEADVAVDITGVISTDAGFVGRAELSALRASEAFALSRALDLNPTRWAWTREPLRLEAELKATLTQFVVDSGELKVGDQSVTFSGMANAGEQNQFSLKAELGSLDVARLLPVGPAQSRSTEPQILDRLLASQTPWQGDIKINGQLLRLGEQTLRDLALDAGIEAAQWTVRNAALTLPGQTRLTFAGLWSDDTAALEGAWRANSQDLRALLTWLDVDVASLPPERLSTLGATGTIQASDKAVVLSDLALGFDATQVTGRVSFGLGDSTPTSVNLDIDRLALDIYGPLLRRFVMPPQPNATPSQPGYGVAPLAPWLSTFATQRATLRIAVAQLTWRDVLAGQLGVDIAFGDGVADIRSVAFEDVSGAALWLGGKIENLNAIPVADGLQFDLKVTDVARFARATRAQIPDPLRDLGPWLLTGAVNGSLVEAAVVMDGKVGPITLKARGAVGVPEGKPKYETTLEVAHPDMAALRTAMWGKKVFPTKISGPLAISAKVKLQEQQFSFEDVTAAFGPHQFQARIAVDDKGAIRDVKADITAINFDATALTDTPLLPIPVPGDWQGEVTLAGPLLKTSIFDARDFSARYVVAKNTAELAEWRGKLFDGPAQVAVKWAKEPDPSMPERWAHLLQGQVVINDANPALMLVGLPTAQKGKADVTVSFKAQAPAPTEWMQALNGSGSFRTVLPANTTLKSSGALAPLSAIVRAESANGRTTTPLETSSTFTLTNGVVQLNDFAMKANAYTARFDGTVDLARDVFDLEGTLRLKDRGLIAGPTAKLVLPPTVPVTITGPMQAPTIKLDTSGAQR